MLETKQIPNLPKQTTPTNCFAACLAALLGCDIASVPRGADGATWDWEETQRWLASEFGLQLLEVTFCNGGTIYPMSVDIPCILTGQSPRECTTGRHAVVATTKGLEGFHIIFDPHESDAGLIGDPTHACFFIPIEVTRVFMSREEDGL
jgi:hypothetical protein